MSELSHTDESGRARMVDVGEKAISRRRALARGRVEMGEEAMRALLDNNAAKGDVLAVARLAGIMGAKRTSDLIPLCHPLGLDHVELRFETRPDDEPPCLLIEAESRCQGRTGVEMEAMCAVGLAALTVYDMLKGVERGIRISNIELLEKDGGKSGLWRRRD